jgi:hypothetical protein
MFEPRFSIGVADIGRTAKFYDAALKPARLHASSAMRRPSLG